MCSAGVQCVHSAFQWEEVVSQKAQLEEQRQAAATAEANRRVFLSQEEEENEQHRDNLRRSQDHSLSEPRPIEIYVVERIGSQI